MKVVGVIALVLAVGTVVSSAPVDDAEMINPLCDGKKTGFNAIEGDLFHFILCLGANSYVFACPRGLVWSDTSGYCDVTGETGKNAVAQAPGDWSQTASGEEILSPFSLTAKDFYAKKERSKRPGELARKEKDEWEGEAREKSSADSHEEQENDVSEEDDDKENGYGSNDKLMAASGDISKPFKDKGKHTIKSSDNTKFTFSPHETA